MGDSREVNREDARSREIRTISGVLAASGGMALIFTIALAVMVALAFILSKQPVRTLTYFFLGPVQNIYYFGNMLNSAIPLMFGGLGVAIAMQGGSLNLGGEGQIYTGALVATICALALARLGVFGALLALAAGAIAAGVVAGFSGFLKVTWNTNELITSFLLSNALILINNYMITGPFLDPATNLQSTRKIAETLWLPQILPPSNLSAALYLAILAVILLYFFLYRTRIGYEIRICGLNERFAWYGGINAGRITTLAMFISGGLYGLGGGLAVLGSYHAAIKEFSAGMGWNGLAVALIARSRPQAILPAAIFFAWIGAGSRMAMQFSDVTYEIASIVQSVIFFLVTSLTLRNLFNTRMNNKMSRIARETTEHQ